MEDGKVLVLRCAREDMTSSVNRITGKMFYWPTSGPVSCDDWDPEQVCGNGLHGWLWGTGETDSCRYYNLPDNKWLVVEVDADDIIELQGKVKFPKGKVIFCGDRNTAVEMISTHAPPKTQVMFANVILMGSHDVALVGDHGMASAGSFGTAIAGVRGTATVGNSGTAWAGNHGKAVAGNHGSARAGVRGTAIAGDRGFAISDFNGSSLAGDFGKAISGDDGVALAGICGSAIVGNGGTANVKYGGTAQAGLNGICSAGHSGVIMIQFHLGGTCFRWITGKIGFDGLRPDVTYRLNDKGDFVVA